MIRNLLREFIGLSKRTLLGYDKNVLTFSQAGEDLVIRNFFYEKIAKGEPGLYLDVGAFHPYLHSNTFYLYRCGWQGINVDARPGIKDLFDKHRPRDINIESAVSIREGEIELHCFDSEPTLNTVSKDYTQLLGTENRISRTVLVPSTRLDVLLDRHLGKDRKIDFFSIDIEGGEVSALLSNDWDRFRSELIAVEIYGKSLQDITDSDIASLLLSRGYELFARVILPSPNVNTAFFVDTAP